MKKRYPILILIISILLFIPIQIKAEIKSNIVPIYTAEDFQNALDSTEYDGYTFKVLNDIAGNFTHNVNKSFTLDLNNHYITGMNDGTVITLVSGTMTLMDSSVCKVKHYYRLSTNNRCAVITYDETDEAYSFEGGYITGGYAQDGFGGGIYVFSSASLIMNSGTIIGNYAAEEGGGIYALPEAEVIITGGSIIGNNAERIHGNNVTISGKTQVIDNVSSGLSGNFVINGGYISRNDGNGISVKRSISSNGRLVINNGEISKNQGYGVSFDGNSFKMTNGIIKENKYSGISISDGTFEMKNGKIINNKQSGINSYVGPLTISNGEISGNQSSGIVLGNRMSICGSPKVIDNYKTSNGKKVNSNVLLMDSHCYITIDGNLSDDAVIGISLHRLTKGTTVVFTKDISDKSKIKCFKSDIPECEIVEKGSQLALRIPDTLSTDDATATTQIHLQTPQLTKAKNDKKKTITLKWKKIDSIDGYQIQYSLNKKFTKSVKAKIAKSTATSIKLKKLKKKKTYYIRLRSYKGSEYSQWSEIKKVKVKK